MKKQLFLLCIISSFFSCDRTTDIRNRNFKINLLPQPKEISFLNKEMVLSKTSKIYSLNPELYPLLALFKSELQKLTGVVIETTTIKNADADIIFEIDTMMPHDEYFINTDHIIQIKGGSYYALASAKTTLLQLFRAENDVLTFPLVKIKDYPDAVYRGLMLDLAAHWHSVATLKKLIDLAAFYKINYVHLHFTDDKSFTLPSGKYPKLPTPGRHYSVKDLKEIEAYSQLRGVTIIPEIDVPGHSSPFMKMYPGIFAIKNIAVNPRIINMGKEEVYKALNDMIWELAKVFKATPYIHIGGDEAIFDMVDKDPDVQAYMKKHGLGNDINELYRHFIMRMNDIVKKHKKQMCVWEGFGNDGGIEISKDIVVFEFETNRYLPDLLIKDGYTVVNTSWKPLYVVNNKKWEPKTIYQWNMWRWENWWSEAPSFHPIQAEKSPLVIGAEMCSWGQIQDAEIPSLRKRLPALSERIWNTERQITYEKFINRLNALDQRLSILVGDNRQDSLLIDYNFIR